MSGANERQAEGGSDAMGARGIRSPRRCGDATLPGHVAGREAVDGSVGLARLATEGARRGADFRCARFARAATILGITGCALIVVWLDGRASAACMARAADAVLVQAAPPKPPPAPPAGASPAAKEAPKEAPKDAPKDAPRQGQTDNASPKPGGVPPGAAPSPSKPEKPTSDASGGGAKGGGGKTLDELLGLSGAKPAAGEGQANKPGDQGNGGSDGASGGGDGPGLEDAKRRLERGLNEQELESLLKQALSGMERSASRLGEKTDTSIETQRVQEDVVAKLDQLIQEAKRRSKSGQSSSSSKSSSSSSSQQSQQQANAKPGEQGKQQPGESKSHGDKSSGKAGDGNREHDGPAPVDPAEDQAALDESRSEWGSLPARVRDLIRQGSRDRVASLYQRLTQEYYRRMAEDASR